MKTIFYLSVLGLLIFEISNVYLIMPFPGSQRIDSLDWAYFLYHWRWAIRVAAILLTAVGIVSALKSSKWHLLVFIPLIVVVYLFNFKFSADRMFLEPRSVVLKNAAENEVGLDRLIVGTARNGEAKAYPIQFIAYHHKIQDVIAGQPIMVTYCTVCRTGKIFEPLVGGKTAVFRLVGMDKFNAMFEDSETGSWWRQANGEAVAGSRKGEILPEFDLTQTTLGQWLKLHPNSLIMQPDPEFADKYAGYQEYEDGKGGDLTGTNPNSWQDKSWVVGIVTGKSDKAYDWNRLKEAKIINDEIGQTPIVLVLADDGKSFFAFERPDKQTIFTLQNNRLTAAQTAYSFAGQAESGGVKPLTRINAYQEFWHSWRTFHPDTAR